MAMRWPDIFYKGKKRPPESELPPPFNPQPEAALAPSTTPEIKPVSVLREPPPPASTLPPKSEPAKPDSTTYPGGGIILRPSLRSLKAQASPAPSVSPEPNVARDMAEADSIRALTRSGGVRLSKRPNSEPRKTTGPIVKPISSTSSPEPVAQATPVTPPTPQVEAAPVETPQVSPAPETPAPTAEIKQENVPSQTPPVQVASDTTSPTPEVPPADKPASAPLRTFGLIFRRKAKMTDVARIVLPPKHEEHELPSPPQPEASSAVIPPSFSVAVETGSIIQTEKVTEATPPVAAPVVENTSAEKSPTTEDKPAAEIYPEVKEQPQSEPASTVTEPEKKAETPVTEPPPAPAPVVDEKPTTPLPEIPKVDSDVPKSEPPSTPPGALSIPTGSKDKREFLLTNGERILGAILSETPETIYIDHATLGVLTIQRAQIAKRPIEIILINGDRIVGDIMAETDDTLYVRHASLGMLTVPRSQRSTRVVEAILTDGDRILGEVLAETENFTVIRSATLGTVAVPHNKVSMLNRKIEQIQLKSLPPAAPELQDKPAE